MKIADYEAQGNSSLREVTLCFLIRNGEVLLATKKVRFGEGRVTGIGGKVEDGENPVDAVSREVEEEIEVSPKTLSEVGKVYFYNPYQTEDFVEKSTGRKYAWDSLCHVYICTEWEGEPKETEEMAPMWFRIDEVPYERMWGDAKYWLPDVLKGKQVNAKFIFNKEFSIEDSEVTFV